MSHWIRGFVSLFALVVLVTGTGHGETLHGGGELVVPTPEGQGLDSVEVSPLNRIEGKVISYAWRFEVQHVVSTDSREAALILYFQYRVAEGADLSGRVDFAFFDGEGRLLHTWETDEYTFTNTEADDPERFPTSRVFEASDDYGLPLEHLEAIRSYKVVLRADEK